MDALFVVVALMCGLTTVEMDTNDTRLIRDYFGDVFTLSKKDCNAIPCNRLSRMAAAMPGHDCKCQCAPSHPTFREDIRECVKDLRECPVAMFVRPFTVEKFPLVSLPLTGQLVYPGAHLVLSGVSVENPVQPLPCEVKKVGVLSSRGWKEVAKPGKNHMFELYQDGAKTFLQWLGSNEDRWMFQQHLVLIRLSCENKAGEGTFESCAAIRVGWAPGIETPEKEIELPSQSSNYKFIIIGLCMGILGLIYVLAVLVYLKVRKNRLKEQRHRTSLEETVEDEENFAQENSQSDKKQESVETVNEQTGSQLLVSEPHALNLTSTESVNIGGSSFADTTVSYRQTFPSGKQALQTTIASQIHSTQQKPVENPPPKLTLIPEYFEPKLLASPPLPALQILIRIREMIGAAKKRLQSLRYNPTLVTIPEDDYFFWDFKQRRIEQSDTSKCLKVPVRENKTGIEAKDKVECYHSGVLETLELGKELMPPQPPPRHSRLKRNQNVIQDCLNSTNISNGLAKKEKYSENSLWYSLKPSQTAMENMSKFDLFRLDLYEKIKNLQETHGQQAIQEEEKEVPVLEVKHGDSNPDDFEEWKENITDNSTENVSIATETELGKQTVLINGSPLASIDNSRISRRLLLHRLSLEDDLGTRKYNKGSQDNCYFPEKEDTQSDITKHKIAENKPFSVVNTMEQNTIETNANITSSKEITKFTVQDKVSRNSDDFDVESTHSSSDRFDDSLENSASDADIDSEAVSATNVQLVSKNMLTEIESTDKRIEKASSIMKPDITYERKGDLMLSKLNGVENSDSELSDSLRRFNMKNRRKSCHDKDRCTSKKSQKGRDESASDSDHPSIEDYLELSNRLARKLSEGRIPGMNYEFSNVYEEKEKSPLSQLIKDFRGSIGKLNKHFEISSKYNKNSRSLSPVSENWTLKKGVKYNHKRKELQNSAKRVSSLNGSHKAPTNLNNDRIFSCHSSEDVSQNFLLSPKKIKNKNLFENDIHVKNAQKDLNSIHLIIKDFENGNNKIVNDRSNIIITNDSKTMIEVELQKQETGDSAFSATDNFSTELSQTISEQPSENFHSKSNSDRTATLCEELSLDTTCKEVKKDDAERLIINKCNGIPPNVDCFSQDVTNNVSDSEISYDNLIQKVYCHSLESDSLSTLCSDITEDSLNRNGYSSGTDTSFHNESDVSEENPIEACLVDLARTSVATQMDDRHVKTSRAMKGLEETKHFKMANWKHICVEKGRYLSQKDKEFSSNNLTSCVKDNDTSNEFVQEQSNNFSRNRQQGETNIQSHKTFDSTNNRDRVTKKLTRTPTHVARVNVQRSNSIPRHDDDIVKCINEPSLIKNGVGSTSEDEETLIEGSDKTKRRCVEAISDSSTTDADIRNQNNRSKRRKPLSRNVRKVVNSTCKQYLQHQKPAETEESGSPNMHSSSTLLSNSKSRTSKQLSFNNDVTVINLEENETNSGENNNFITLISVASFDASNSEDN
ncbi:shavenoid [Tachypleus tridentatus]|uniref:shavenoid n=1 Tax=Tachypleus tridentatus TaxID=6853 RepID=UPI003FD3B895